MTAFGANAVIDGLWKFHPAMQTVTSSNPHHAVKIMPGAERTYFLVHAQMYDANAPTNSVTPYLQLFYHDNSKPIVSANLLPVENLIESNLGCILDCEYFPEGGFLFGFLADGTSFRLTDTGVLTTGENLLTTVNPARFTINGITFNPSDNTVWVATSRGIIAFNSDSLSIKTEIPSSQEIVSAAPVGKYLLASFAPEKGAQPVIHFTQLSDLPTDCSEFSPLSATGDSEAIISANDSGNRVACLFGISPLTEHTFTFISQSSQKGCVAINVGSLDENESKVFTLHTAPLSEVKENHKVFSPYEGIISRSSNGYNFKFNNIFHLSKGIDLDLSIGEEEAISKFKDESSFKELTVEASLYNSDFRSCKAASSDGTRFWFYLPAKGFILRENNDGDWTDLSETVFPNAPTVHQAQWFVWSPKYGMLCRPVVPTTYGGYVSWPVYDTLCGYKNNVWTSYGLALTNYGARGVHVNPAGIAFDPDYPELIYSGSFLTGLLRLNLDAPEDYLHITVGNNYKPQSSPKDVKISDDIDIFTPAASLWSCFTEPKTDAYGNMWTAYFWGTDCHRNEVMFCYWRKNDRDASASASDPVGGFRKWKTIHIKQGLDRTNRQILVPLITEKNRNILVYTPADYGSPVMVYDHNGTPEDTSDDRVGMITEAYDSLGRICLYDYATDFFEDPFDGRVWFMTQSGLFWFDPHTILENGNRLNRLEVEDAVGYNGKTVMLEVSGATSMCVDTSGRKWIGTDKGGILCISEDSSTLLAQLTTENSELADDSVTALGWNPENNSLMISTLAGIQEFFPDEFSINGSTEKVYPYPSVAHPGFTGFITFHNLDNSKQYKVTNTSDDTVITLGSPNGKILQWAPTAKGGNRVACGEYILSEENSETELTRVVIM